MSLVVVLFVCDFAGHDFVDRGVFAGWMVATIVGREFLVTGLVSQRRSEVWCSARAISAS